MNTKDSDKRVINQRELQAYRAALKLQIFKKIRQAFNERKHGEGFSQKDLAYALGIDESVLSKRLNGKHDMRLETFSDLARGLECKLDVMLRPISEIERLSEEAKRNFEPQFKPSIYMSTGNAPLTTYGTSTEAPTTMTFKST